MFIGAWLFALLGLKSSCSAAVPSPSGEAVISKQNLRLKAKVLSPSGENLF